MWILELPNEEWILLFGVMWSTVKMLWGYQIWNIRFEGKLTSLWCSASFYAIPFNFSPLAKLRFTLFHCIIRTSTLGDLGFLYVPSNANHCCQPLWFHDTFHTFYQRLSFFPEDRISCLVKREWKKNHLPFRYFSVLVLKIEYY